MLGQLVGCGVKPGNPERQHRHTAEQMVMEEWVDGELAYGNGDRTDWKNSNSIRLQWCTFRSISTFQAAAELGVYNRVGVPLGSVTKGEGATKTATLAVNAPRRTIFYSDPRHGPEPTSYSVRPRFPP